ncbi:polysaccharide deacetylase family protein [Brevibacterium moorei]|uniref:polysaccharide deacetylase family protein n=1 Tax=Brevibacterium moorei TaxID=2968457 RepID=UPI00211D0B94|nr:polysaccharide deacetylase family protein [Brevibacterium sp. 68QC2CO]MCQ9385382.1 polysaccharide deacetylase family protein [Brevibacterium sp. 68QC2CO]
MKTSPRSVARSVERSAAPRHRATLAKTLTASALAVTLALTGCTSGTSSNESGNDAANATNGTGGAQASAAAEPTETQDPTALKPGTNHSYAADEAGYVYKSKDVHDWLWGEKKESKTYPKKKIAFLTFDDGPTNTTPKVLKQLKKNDVPATFFVIGGELGVERKGSPAHLKDEIAAGHSVAIHSYSHNFHKLYPGRVAKPKAIVKEYEKTLANLREAVDPEFNTHTWRYPGGHGWNGMKPADKALNAKGMNWIDWNSENGDGTDTASSTGSGRAQRALSTIGTDTRVAVILMHDYKDNEPTVDSITPVVKRLKKLGFEFGVMD